MIPSWLYNVIILYPTSAISAFAKTLLIHFVRKTDDNFYGRYFSGMVYNGSCAMAAKPIKSLEFHYIYSDPVFNKSQCIDAKGSIYNMLKVKTEHTLAKIEVTDSIFY